MNEEIEDLLQLGPPVRNAPKWLLLWRRRWRQGANPDLALWTANERLKEAKATGAKALVTSCPWCERNFKDAVEAYGEEMEICDIAEIARKAIQVDTH